MSSKSFRKHVFSRFSGTNHSLFTTEAGTEAYRLAGTVGSEMRSIQKMIINIQESMEHLETLHYLDLALHRRKPIGNEQIKVPEKSLSGSIRSKSCVSLNHIVL